MNKENIKEIANKLMFNISDEEADGVLNKLNCLEANTSSFLEIEGLEKVEPMSHTFDLFEANFREDDDFKEGTDIELLLRNSAKHDEREIEVPKVVG